MYVDRSIQTTEQASRSNAIESDPPDEIKSFQAITNSTCAIKSALLKAITEIDDVLRIVIDTNEMGKQVLIAIVRSQIKK